MMTEHIRYGSWSTRNIPDAKKIILVYDNLNTHNVSPLYQAFTTSEILRNMDHGLIWRISSFQCSQPNALTGIQTQWKGFRKKQSPGMWTMDRNSRQKGIDWQLTVGDARTKLKRVHPMIELENQMLQGTRLSVSSCSSSLIEILIFSLLVFIEIVIFYISIYL